MKKKILLLMAVCTTTISFAQKVIVGTAAGVTNYSMRGDAVNSLKSVISIGNNLVQTQPVTGFYAGGYATIPVTEIFSIEPALYFAQKGFQLKGSYSVKNLPILSANATSSLQANYIDLPLVLKANLNGWQVFAGPQLSYLVNASLHNKVSAIGISILNNSIDLTNQFNRWDAAVTGGIGYQFANGLRITAAYERGLKKVDAGSNLQSYNQGVKVGAGFSF